MLPGACGPQYLAGLSLDIRACEMRSFGTLPARKSDALSTCLLVAKEKEMIPMCMTPDMASSSYFPSPIRKSN